jgi:hypothetical protein
MTDEKKANLQMKDSEMDSLLAELQDTKYWPAIERWVLINDINYSNSLKTFDPFSQQVFIARSQGFLSGIWALKEYVLSKKKESDEKNSGKKKDEHDPSPSYNNF